MDWIQVLFIIGANLGTVIGLYLYTDKKIFSQGQRIDDLYRMFCEMQKEIKDIYKSWDKKNK